MSESHERTINLFISFAVADIELQQSLLKHLSILERIGDIRCWSVEDIPPGASRLQELKTALERADVALLLLSADFLSSDFLQEVEVPQLFLQREQRGLRVVPVLLRTCPWEYHPWIGSLNPLPRNAVSIAACDADRRDQALSDVVKEIATIAFGADASPKGVPGLPSQSRPNLAPSAKRSPMHQALRTAAVVSVLAIGALLAATQSDKLIGLIGANADGCPGGSRNFDGFCVAPTMANFLVCLKENNVIAASKMSSAELRNLSGSAQLDDATLRTRLSQELPRLSAEDRALVYRFCLDAARGAGVLLPPDAELSRSSHTSPAPPPSGAAEDVNDGGADDADADAGDDVRESDGGGSIRGNWRDTVGCGGPLNHLGLCGDASKASCREIGGACSAKALCCGLYASCQHGVCKTCGAIGTSCAQQQDCCAHLNLKCEAGMCIQCIPSGSACDKKFPCCGGLSCDNGLCSSSPKSSRPVRAPTCNCQKDDPLCSCL